MSFGFYFSVLVSILFWLVSVRVISVVKYFEYYFGLNFSLGFVVGFLRRIDVWLDFLFF